MRTTIALFMALAVIGCQDQQETQPYAPPPAKPKTVTAAPAAQVPQIASGLQTPESVFYDPEQDVYLISNINGDPLAADNNGYISRVNPDTLQIEAKWIEAGKNGVTLNAPKGSGVVGDTFYVADITTVRKFDRKTGAAKGDIPIPGSTFLNDIATDGTSVYVSDSGMKAGAKGGFEPTGTDAVWKITNDQPVKIAGGSDLNRPNGLEVVDGNVWCVSFGSNELYQIERGKKANVMHLPKGSLDGLVHLADGSFLVTSWDAKTVYRGKNNDWKAVVENVTGPADIGYDTKRHRLLVPHFMDSIVTIHPLQ